MKVGQQKGSITSAQGQVQGQGSSSSLSVLCERWESGQLTGSSIWPWLWLWKVRSRSSDQESSWLSSGRWSSVDWTSNTTMRWNRTLSTGTGTRYTYTMGLTYLDLKVSCPGGSAWETVSVSTVGQFVNDEIRVWIFCTSVRCYLQ